MTVDPAVIPGLLLLAAEFAALAAIGYLVARVVLRQSDDRVAMAQGLVVGLALWGVIVNFALYIVPGLAGAAVGWIVILTLGVALAWRTGGSIRPRPRLAAGFTFAAAALFWVALASRQLLVVPDSPIHLGLSSTIRAGKFPPEVPWVPGVPAQYNHAFDLLVGLLAPPVGPDLAFVNELLGVFVWIGFALIVVTTLIQRASRVTALALAPLLLTAGAWTLVFATPPHVLQIPVPVGMPAPGLRASLADIFWPSVQLPWGWPAWASDGVSTATPPNNFKPLFILAYALAFVVLERAAAPVAPRWSRSVVLALLVGLLGLADGAVALIVLGLWMVLAATACVKARQAGAASTGVALRHAAGPALAAILLAAGGGILTGALHDTTASGLSFRLMDDLGSRRPLGALSAKPGGIGLLGFGPLVVAGAAVILGWRDRLALALAAGAAVFLVAALTIQYEFSQRDVFRLDGHARNFALLALMLALGVRLANLRPRWRFAALAILIALIVWPTSVAPARNLGLAVGQGTRLANAQLTDREFIVPMGPQVLTRFPSDRIAAYIRQHTTIDARIFSPSPIAMTNATGRPNAAGLVGLLHYNWFHGPEYRDVLERLEPAAIRRLGISYLHAPDTWVHGLPDQAARRLNDPRLFELLVRDGAEALYLVRPSLQHLKVSPHPQSFEALRQAVPPAATIYLSPGLSSLADPHSVLRLAASLPQARLVGSLDISADHVRAIFPVAPLGADKPDLVVTSLQFAPWMFSQAARKPIWWKGDLAVYAPNEIVGPIMSNLRWAEPPTVSTNASKLKTEDGRVTFSLTFHNRSSDEWTRQDWVAIPTDNSPWNLPLAFEPDRRTPVAAAWFDGWIGSGVTTTTHTYEFDAGTSRLSVGDSHGAFTASAASGGIDGAGAWILALRLRDEWQPGYWRVAALIPVLRINASDDGQLSYQVYNNVSAGSVNPAGR